MRAAQVKLTALPPESQQVQLRAPLKLARQVLVPQQVLVRQQAVVTQQVLVPLQAVPLQAVVPLQALSDSSLERTPGHSTQ